MGAPLLTATPAAAHGAMPGDVNGDGYRDAVLPAPGANVAGKAGAGAVVVLYGAKSGLSASRRADITQNTGGGAGRRRDGGPLRCRDRDGRSEPGRLCGSGGRRPERGHHAGPRRRHRVGADGAARTG
ncbi:integrin alpha [Streptomyces massasporeus]|uniref:FG-GAP repeat protein n=1 Tax=Streptomyces massasporeus TaxID=67324 RepID=UPI0033ABA224